MSNLYNDKRTGWTKSYWSVTQALLPYPDAVSKLWHWLLSVVNFKKNEITFPTGKGETAVMIQPGQYVSGISSLVRASHISEWKVRSALKTLGDLGLITIDHQSHYAVIMITDFEKYYFQERAFGLRAITEKTSGQYSPSFPVSDEPTENSKGLRAITEKTSAVLRISKEPEKERSHDQLASTCNSAEPNQSHQPLSKSFQKEFAQEFTGIDIGAEWKKFLKFCDQKAIRIDERNPRRLFHKFLEAGKDRGLLEKLIVYYRMTPATDIASDEEIDSEIRKAQNILKRNQSGKTKPGHTQGLCYS
jgi:hypothetical protein